MQTTGNSTLSEISLYFHIPFCTRKCDYCHFYVLPDKEDYKQQLLEGFRLEWKRLQPFLAKHSIRSLYFGGGTPFLFGPQRIEQVIQWVQRDAHLLPSAEITLEANPENVSLEIMQAYVSAGINRVSLGVQTLDPTLLHLLGRLHRPETALDAVETVFRAGISNLTIDLMYDLPQQKLSHWEYTLDQVVQLPLTHLSLYNLTIEPHTLFFKRQDQLRPQLPSEELSLAMYEMAISRLESAGLKQYEISAFAKPGYESQHNSGYWTGRPFWGLGPSAFSYWEGKRFSNVAHLGRYCKALREGKSPIDFEEKLDDEARRKELLICQLRLCRGVHLDQFYLEHGELDPLTLKILEELKAQEFLTQEDLHLCLTKKGRLFYDYIAVELV